ATARPASRPPRASTPASRILAPPPTVCTRICSSPARSIRESAIVHARSFMLSITAQGSRSAYAEGSGETSPKLRGGGHKVLTLGQKVCHRSGGDHSRCSHAECIRQV